MRIAVNTIRQSLTMVAKSGIKLDSEEKDLGEFYQITIRIPKKIIDYVSEKHSIS